MTQNKQNMFDFLKNMIDVFIGKDGKVNMSRFWVGLFICLATAAYAHAENLASFVKYFYDSYSYESYEEARLLERKHIYDASVKNQSQLIYSTIRPDMVGIFTYEPEDIHHFSNMIHYEGALPEGHTVMTYSNSGVNKSVMEYYHHISSMPFLSEHKGKNIANVPYYSYTCPIYSSRNVYYGFIGLFWNEKPKDFTYENNKLFSMCYQGARQIGLHKD